MNKKYIGILLMLMPLLGFIGCDDRLDVLDNNNPTVESYFKNIGELEKGVNSVYSTLRAGKLVGREWFYVHDMRGAECAAGGPQLEAPRAELLKEPSPSSANSVMTAFWTGLYQLINRANLVIVKGVEIEDNTGLRDRIIGEAMFLRAWAYFELVSLWESVPVYTEPISSAKDYRGLTSKNDIYALIEKDLNYAIQKLPESYTSADRGRVTKGAAYAQLGKVLMQKGEYNKAKEALMNIYGKYSLVDNYEWNFDGDVKDDFGNTITLGHEFNEESIFEVVFIDKGDNDFNWGGNGEGVSSALSTIRNQEYGITWGNVIPSNYALEQFPNSDPRYKFTFWEEGDKILDKSPQGGKILTADEMNIATSNRHGVVKKRFLKKYGIYDWVNSGYHPSGINQRVIRYADVLLMLAECEAELNNPSNAAKYVNEVRSRPSVNMPAVSFASKDEAIVGVMHERAVELCGEEKNFIDNLRWRARGYYSNLKGDPKPGQINVFPIPAIEISGNPLIN